MSRASITLNVPGAAALSVFPLGAAVQPMGPLLTPPSRRFAVARTGAAPRRVIADR